MRDRAWLEESKAALDRVFFSDSLSEWSIGWTLRTRSKRHIVFARCYIDAKHIALNPVLRDPWVPDIVVMSTIHHEMVHALGFHEHDAAFNIMDRQYPHYAAVLEWCARNEEELLARQVNRVRSRSPN